LIFWWRIADSLFLLKSGILHAGNGFCEVAEKAAGTAAVRRKVFFSTADHPSAIAGKP
jgi:hypothetical protein